MSELTKVQQLELLRDETKALMTDAWFFPTIEPVQGFVGTGSIMFVGERPSTGSFTDKASLFFYSLLEKHGVSDAHLSDVVKTRAKARDIYPEDMTPHWNILNREIEILKPQIVIALGRKTYDMLQFCLSGSGSKLQWVYHYSYTRRGTDKADMLDEQIRLAVNATHPVAAP